jgi:cyclin-dependent kinase-like
MMEKYENLGLVGEGSYGMVMKCRHKETSQLVAIKKFIETENDKMVKKIAMREIRMLKQLRHENLINLLEVFRRKKRLHLVFEFVDHTALDEIEKLPGGVDELQVKKIMWQVLKGIEFCHQHNVVHRDVKPENILISRRGVVKICDFGFARAIAPPGEAYTDYVATRWYRSPELLVGDTNYGRAVDVWAIGCLFAEMLTSEALFQGESDIDQLYMITKCFGSLIARHKEIFSRNPLFIGMRLPEPREIMPIERRYPRLSPAAMDIIKWSLRLDPSDRPTCTQLLKHELFQRNGWSDKFVMELRTKIMHEIEDNPLVKSLGVTIYGSVYDMQNEITKEKTDNSTTQLSNGAEPFTKGAEDSSVKKKKKPKLHREKTNTNSLLYPDGSIPKAINQIPSTLSIAATGHSPYEHSILKIKSPSKPVTPAGPTKGIPSLEIHHHHPPSLEPYSSQLYHHHGHQGGPSHPLEMPHQPGTPSQSKHSSPRGSLVDGHKPTLSRIRDMNILSQSNTSIGATPLTGIAQDFIGERRYGASPLSSSRPPPVKKQMPNTGMIGLPQLPAPDTSPSSRLPSFTLPSSYSQLHGHSSSMHNPVDSTGARSNFISSQIEVQTYTAICFNQ